MVVPPVVDGTHYCARTQLDAGQAVGLSEMCHLAPTGQSHCRSSSPACVRVRTAVRPVEVRLPLAQIGTSASSLDRNPLCAPHDPAGKRCAMLA